MTPDDVLKLIDPKEVVELALALGNIDSPTGSEGPAGEFAYDHDIHALEFLWLERG